MVRAASSAVDMLDPMRLPTKEASSTSRSPAIRAEIWMPRKTPTRLSESSVARSTTCVSPASIGAESTIDSLRARAFVAAENMRDFKWRR